MIGWYFLWCVCSMRMYVRMYICANCAAVQCMYYIYTYIVCMCVHGVVAAGAGFLFCLQAGRWMLSAFYCRILASLASDKDCSAPLQATARSCATAMYAMYAYIACWRGALLRMYHYCCAAAASRIGAPGRADDGSACYDSWIGGRRRRRE